MPRILRAASTGREIGFSSTGPLAHALLRGGVMDNVFFGLKRAYQASLRVTREITKRRRLTPARFDLLYAIGCARWMQLRQSQLRRILGVTRTTVSRMVQALVREGFLRECVSFDARSPNWTLTARGKRALFFILREQVESMAAHRHVARVFMGSYSPLDSAAFAQFTELLAPFQLALQNQRQLWWDTGSLKYFPGRLIADRFRLKNPTSSADLIGFDDALGDLSDWYCG